MNLNTRYTIIEEHPGYFIAFFLTVFAGIAIVTRVSESTRRDAALAIKSDAHVKSGRARQESTSPTPAMVQSSPPVSLIRQGDPESVDSRYKNSITFVFCTEAAGKCEYFLAHDQNDTYRAESFVRFRSLEELAAGILQDCAGRDIHAGWPSLTDGALPSVRDVTAEEVSQLRRLLGA